MCCCSSSALFFDRLFPVEGCWQTMSRIAPGVISSEMMGRDVVLAVDLGSVTISMFSITSASWSSDMVLA